MPYLVVREWPYEGTSVDQLDTLDQVADWLVGQCTGVHPATAKEVMVYEFLRELPAEELYAMIVERANNRSPVKTAGWRQSDPVRSNPGVGKSETTTVPRHGSLADARARLVAQNPGVYEVVREINEDMSAEWLDSLRDGTALTPPRRK